MRSARLFASLFLTTAFGCGDAGDGSRESVAGGNGGVGAGGASGDAGTAGSDGFGLGSSTVSGRVVNPEGEAVTALSVTLCGKVCTIVKTDDDGRFRFEKIGAGVKVIEAATVPAEGDFTLAVRSWTRFFDFVSVGDDEDIAIEKPMVLHRVEGAVGPLSGTEELQLTPALHVSLDANRIVDEGPLPAGADGVWLGAVEIPVEDWPQSGLGDWKVLAVWGLAIWDLAAPDVFTVRATLPTPVAADAEVAFLVADYAYGFTEGEFFEEAAELSEDGLSISTPVSGGLDRATRWLAVTRSP